MTHEVDTPPFITVIVPVRNEERFIVGTLGQLMGQDYPVDRFEVLVIDGRSTDATRALVGGLLADHPNLRLLDNPARLSSAARNVGIRNAQGKLVIVVDGHCQLPSPSYLSNVADAFARSGADCLGRPQPLDVTGATNLQRAIAAARSSRLGHNPASFIYSSDESFVPPQSVAVAYDLTRSDTSTNAMTPARTSSSTTGSTGLACAVFSHHRSPSAIIRDRTCRACCVR